MLSKSDKGEQARNYFIKCEAVLNSILDSPKVAATVPAPAAPAQLPASKPLPRSSQETLNYALFCLESLYHHFSRLERLKKYAFLKNDDDNGFLLCSLGQLLHIKDTLKQLKA
ncbi:hypothetical protein AGMMS49975_26280 [Clostridia bacterium]|nr:hypothetical protein AGMMS49975_26280 [Clostridia bacterium]